MKRSTFMSIAIHLMAALMFFAMITPTAFGQDSDGDPDTSEVITDLQEDATLFLDELVVALSTLVFLPFATPLVTALTSLSKKLLPFEAKLQSLAWSVVIWGIYAFIARAGYAEQFETLVPAIATIIATGTGMLLTPTSSAFLYERFKEQKIPLLGTQRS